MSLKNHEELQVIQDCLKGTQRAFKALYDSYHGYVYTICVRYGISTMEIKDCMQTIFMEVFKSLQKYDPAKSKFKTWLSRIAINQILVQKRKAKINYSSLETEEVHVVKSDFSIPVEARMDEEIMHQLLAKMPAKYSAVFNLFIIDGYAHAEIAKMLNISTEKSRILLHRGRIWAIKELKEIFKDAVQVFNRKTQ